MADNLSRKQIPSNPDLERQVLGAILTNSKAMDQVATVLNPEDFYIPKHQSVYRAALELYTARDAIDTVTIGAKLPALQTAIDELVDGLRAPGNIETHAKVVKQLSEKREILEIAHKLVAMAYDKELVEVKTFAKDVVTKVLTTDDERRSLLGPKDQIEILRRIIDEKRSGITHGILSGFERLDSLTGGLRRGDLVVLGARTSVGKSSWAECVAENVASTGYPVLFVSVEMDPSQMAFRFAKRWGLSPAILEHGSNDEFSIRELDKLVASRMDMPLYIWNAPGASTVGIRAHINQLISEVGSVDLVIVDYLQLLTDTFGGKVPEHLRLGMITKTLKQIAREYEIPIILVTQLNRNSDQRGVLPEPRLSDIRESGRIEEDADLILFLWREKNTDAFGNDTKMKISKNRQGALGEVPVIFNKPYFKFVEPTDQQLQQALVVEEIEETKFMLSQLAGVLGEEDGKHQEGDGVWTDPEASPEDKEDEFNYEYARPDETGRAET